MCKTACLLLTEIRIRLDSDGYNINMNHKATNQMLVLVLNVHGSRRVEKLGPSMGGGWIGNLLKE